MSKPQRSLRFWQRLARSFCALFQEVSRGIKHLIRLLWRFFNQQFFTRKFRSKGAHKQALLSKAGFVLPTATLVLLVVSLLIGAVVARTGNEAQEAIIERQQQEIYNAATPAIERAKAKIEYLFEQDNRFPVGIPSEGFLNSMLLNDGEKVVQESSDPYTLSDETRLDLNDDTTQDNAWSYETDTDGDGVNDATVRYSISLLTNNGGQDIYSSDEDKANNLLVRSGPLSGTPNQDQGKCQDLAGLESAQGWYSVTGSRLRKNFQVNAVVETDQSVSTLELQQDRDLETGNQWGAWFRYDLEFTPGPEFNWNGAIHTEGSLLLNNNGGNTTRLRLVSSPASCLYTEKSSEISIAQNDDEDTGEIFFQGQLMRVNTNNDNFVTDTDAQDQVRIDLFPGIGQKPEGDTKELILYEAADNAGDPEDSVTPENNVNPSQYQLNPVLLVSEDRSQSRDPDDSTNTSIRDADWNDNPLQERFKNKSVPKPYVDDTYRADDRWGPKPKYQDPYAVTASNNGTLITGGTAKSLLTRIPSTLADAQNAGLDGYWERRAYVEGLRVIVGQRLDVGYVDSAPVNNQREVDDPSGGSGNNFDTLTVTVQVDDGALTIQPQNSGGQGDNAKLVHIEFDPPLPSGTDKINFQPSGFSTPAGFKADTGEAYGDRGGGDTYGWLDSSGSPSANNETRERNTDPDPEKDTLNHMDKGDSNMQWQVEVPNGTYDLTIVMGDPDHTDQDNSIVLEPFVPPSGARPAVQSGAIYHWDGHQTEPASCLALTGYPEVSDSTVFDKITIGGTDYIETDFLNQKGTNGWEFPFYSDFLIDSDSDGVDDTISSPLRKALKNLAYFAGDPEGAFPPKQENGGSITHPYPQLTEWGDFSNLRRAIEQLEAGTTYSNLSLADQTTLQTAACTLGMLAYNLDFKQKQLEAQLEAVETNLSSINWTPVGTQLTNGIASKADDDGEFTKPVIGKGGKVCEEEGTGLAGDGCPTQHPNDVADDSDPEHYTNYFGQFSIDDWITFVEDGGVKSAQKDDVKQVLTEYRDNVVPTLKEISQIQRDRQKGFQPSSITAVTAATANFDPATGLYTIPDSNPGKLTVNQIDPGKKYKLGCDPHASDFIFDFINSDKAKFGVANIICNAALEEDVDPKYPTLFYLFPVQDHDHDGDSANGNDQPTSEDYISDTYIFDEANKGGVNWKDTDDPADDVNDLMFVVLDDDDGNGQENGSEDSIGAIALTPRASDSLVLPTDSDSGANQITDPGGNDLYISFLDKAIYNDREQMDVRVLDIDLDLLRSNTTGNTNDDYWLPTSGSDREVDIVYAFREDAVREDGIARPHNDTWNPVTWPDSDPDDPYYDTTEWEKCNSEALLTGLNVTNGGTVLTGTERDRSDDCRMRLSVPQDPPLNDKTGVSAKPVDGYPDPDRRPYGFRLKNGSDLSRSSDDNTGFSFITDQPLYIQGDFNIHEEEEFTNNSGDFYDRTGLNDNFATPDGETWRPTEVIADGITLLSDGFDSAGDQAINDTVNPSPSGDIEVNAIFVNALSPSLPNQYNGGIHNFPRFLENWGGTVTIQGSLIQLNFSKYATGSFDQENLDSESPSSLNSGVNLPYYSPPTREWGYDVALQYNPPGPVAERFVTRPSPRTETYKELSIEDPYIQNLLNAK